MLASASSGGDERAFELLVVRYRAPLLGYSRARLRNDARAEDVVQQTLISAWVGLSSGAEVENVHAWLFRICRNATIDATRRRGSDWQEISASLPALAAEDELGRRREARELLAAIADLPDRQREGLLRTAIEGQSHARVAEALGLTEGALRGLVYRARATLRAAATALAPRHL
jgi:RNA polymerase sigma factor (sigma-70 family)